MSAPDKLQQQQAALGEILMHLICRRGEIAKEATITVTLDEGQIKALFALADTLNLISIRQADHRKLFDPRYVVRLKEERGRAA